MVATKENPAVFKNDLSIGDVGEYRLKKYLNEFYSNVIHKAEDKSKNAYFQKADIDMLVQFKDGGTYGLEVKCDTYMSGNIYYETISSFGKNGRPDNPGCMEKTQADVLFYILESIDVILTFRMNEFRDWVKKWVKETDAVETIVPNKGYDSAGYKIPIKDILNGTGRLWGLPSYVQNGKPPVSAVCLRTGIPIKWNTIHKENSNKNHPAYKLGTIYGRLIEAKNKWGQINVPRGKIGLTEEEYEELKTLYPNKGQLHLSTDRKLFTVKKWDFSIEEDLIL